VVSTFAAFALAQAQSPFMFQYASPDTASVQVFSLSEPTVNEFNALTASSKNGMVSWNQLRIANDGQVLSEQVLLMDSTNTNHDAVACSDGGFLFSAERDASSFLLTRSNAAGNVVWQKYYVEDTISLRVTNGSNRMIERPAGSFLWLSEHGDNITDQGWDLALLHFSPSGELLSMKEFLNPDGYAQDAGLIAGTPGGGAVIAGEMHSWFSLSSYPYFSLTGFDTDLDTLFSRRYKVSGDSYHRLHAMSVLSNGDILVTGDSRHLPGQPFYPFIARLDSMGTPLWTLQLRDGPGLFLLSTQGITEMSNGELVLWGWVRLTTSITHISYSARVSANGDLIDASHMDMAMGIRMPVWASMMTSSGQRASAYSVYQNGTTGGISLGDTLASGLCFMVPMSWTDSALTTQVEAYPLSHTLVQLQATDTLLVAPPGGIIGADMCLSTDMEEPPTSPFHAFPNPTTGPVWIPLEEGLREWELTDLSGRKVMVGASIHTSGGAILELDLSGLVPGLYNLRLAHAQVSRTLRILKQ